MEFKFYPVTASEHAAANAQHEKTQESNRQFLMKIAAKLDGAEPLDVFEQRYAAAALRSMADRMSGGRPRPSNRPPTIPGDAAVVIASRVVNGASKAEAIEEYMAELGLVDDSTLKKALQRQRYSDVKKSMLENEGKK